MKLKRFLLRYEPPGIGLEVEDSEQNLTVIHKDLPAGDTVQTCEDIYKVADDIILGEPGLITKRRHRPALVQLLGRLYNVEIESEGHSEDGEGKDQHKNKETETPSSAVARARANESSWLREGQGVVILGLKNKLQAHNGDVGTLVKVKEDKDKFEVMLQNEQTLKVKGAEHMVPVAPKGTTFVVGTHVAIRGLRNHIELNGCLGRVVECHEKEHRFEVRATDSGQLFRVKQENLIAIESGPTSMNPARLSQEPTSSPRPKKDGSNAGPSSIAAGAGGTNDTMSAASLKQVVSDGEGGLENEAVEAGAMVQLVGLKTASNYNGQTAEVMSVDRQRGRYEIRLSDGSVKTIRNENVRIVSAPSHKTSPRTRQKGKNPKG